MKRWKQSSSGVRRTREVRVRLRDLRTGDLALGKLVVLVAPEALGPVSLRVVEDIDQAHVHLAPATLFLDDDAVTERIPVPKAPDRLRIPVFEAGDRISFHGRQGTILRLAENDYHVTIRLDEHPAREIYTNLIHLDFTPSLAKIGAHA